jgi:hypothetical protein
MDFIPSNEPGLVIWLTNYKTKIAIIGASIGLTAAEIATEQALCQGIIDAINLSESKERELIAANVAKNNLKKENISSLRKSIDGHKKDGKLTDEQVQELKVKGTATTFDANAYKPVLSVAILAKQVNINFEKQGVQGINLYHRKKGSAGWLFLARATKSPYIDNIKLAAPTQPEHWEYQAYGVMDDKEIGQPSDIVEVVYGE